MMMGISAMAMMGLLSSSFQKRQLQINSENKIAVDVLQQNYSLYIQDETAWKNTFDDPNNSQSFECLKGSANCSVDAKPIRVLRNARNEVVVESSSHKGIKIDGSLCTLSSQDNNDCDFRVEIKWRPICKNSSGNCTIPPPVIEVNISITKSTAANSAARFIASNAAGVVRRPTNIPNATQVVLNENSACALAEGNVYCWGDNWQKILGPGGSSKTPVKIAGLSNVTYIAGGTHNTCAIMNANVYCWGGNSAGQVGVNSGGAPVATPTMILRADGVPLHNMEKVFVGLDHICAIKSNGTAYCWGSNQSGKLGWDEPGGLTPGESNNWYDSTRAQPVIDLSRGLKGNDLGPVTSMALSAHYSCAVVNGGVKCWGTNDARGGNRQVCGSGTRTLGYTPFNNTQTGPSVKGHKICWPYFVDSLPIPLPTPSTTVWNLSSQPLDFNGFFRGSTAANPSSCADNSPIPYAHQVQICNPHPQSPDDPLAPGTDHPQLQSGVKQVAISSETTCALKFDGTMYCWGSYDYGRQAKPVIGNENYPLLVTSISGLESIAGTNKGFCGIKNQQLYCWGHNDVNNAIAQPGGYNMWDTYVDVPVQTSDLPSPVSDYSGGGGGWNPFNCGVFSNRVYCWGFNGSGQLGDGTTTSRINGTGSMVTNWP